MQPNALTQSPIDTSKESPLGPDKIGFVIQKSDEKLSSKKMRKIDEFPAGIKSPDKLNPIIVDSEL